MGKGKILSNDLPIGSTNLYYLRFLDLYGKMSGSYIPYIDPLTCCFGASSNPGKCAATFRTHQDFFIPTPCLGSKNTHHQNGSGKKQNICRVLHSLKQTVRP